jgi:hypothetical protein
MYNEPFETKNMSEEEEEEQEQEGDDVQVPKERQGGYAALPDATDGA